MSPNVRSRVKLTNGISVMKKSSSHPLVSQSRKTRSASACRFAVSGGGGTCAPSGSTASANAKGSAKDDWARRMRELRGGRRRHGGRSVDTPPGAKVALKFDYGALVRAKSSHA